MRASLGRRTLCRCGLPGVHTKNAKSHVDLTFAVNDQPILSGRGIEGRVKSEYVTR
jgi:hypothetical protein